MGWKHTLANTLFSKGFAQSVKKEAALLGLRLLCLSPGNLWKISKLRRRTHLKLNIGSGGHSVEGWTNIDLISTPSGLRWDVRWPLPFKKESVSLIHCEHFLEHLEYPDESNHFLKECFRILKSKGEIRLIVPDAGKYIRAYADKDKRFWDGLEDLGGASPPFETEIEIINQAFRMGGDHRYAYDKHTLTKLLSEAGFKSDEKNSPDHCIDQKDDWRMKESLYLLARKDVPNETV